MRPMPSMGLTEAVADTLYVGGNTVNVLAHGADPLGVEDSYTACAAAITAAGAQGVVYFPRGTYKLSSYLSPLPGQRFIGDGPRASYLKSTDATNSANCIQIAVADVTIEELGFLGQTGKSGANSDIVIYPVGANRCTVRNCYCDGNVQRFLICREESTDLNILDCRLEGTIYSNVIEVNDCNNVLIQGVRIVGQGTSAAETGIEIFGQELAEGRPITRFTIRDCLIEGTGRSGVNFQGAMGGTMTGCTFKGTKGAGTLIMYGENAHEAFAATGIQVLGNTYIDCGTDAGLAAPSIQILGGTGVRVAGNQILSFDCTLSRANSKIYVADGSGCIIEDNLIWCDPLSWRNGAVAYAAYGILCDATLGNGIIIRRNTIANLSTGTQGVSAPACVGISPSNGCLIEDNLIRDDRALALVADSTARLALSSQVRLGMTVVQIDDFSRWMLTFPDTYNIGMYCNLAAHWTKLRPLAHHVCASQAAMLALVGRAVGDIVVRSDLGSSKVKVLTALPASTLGNWADLAAGNANLGGIKTPCLDIGINFPSGTYGNVARNNTVQNNYNHMFYDVANGNQYGPIVRRVILNFGSIAAGATASIDVTFDTYSVRKGMKVVIGPPYDFPAGVILQGIVPVATLTNQVRIIATNTTAGALDPASGIFTIEVSD